MTVFCRVQMKRETAFQVIILQICNHLNRRGRCSHWNKFHWITIAVPGLHWNLFSTVWGVCEKLHVRTSQVLFFSLQLTALLGATEKAWDLSLTVFPCHVHFQNTTKLLGRKNPVIIGDNQKSYKDKEGLTELLLQMQTQTVIQSSGK